MTARKNARYMLCDFALNSFCNNISFLAYGNIFFHFSLIIPDCKELTLRVVTTVDSLDRSFTQA